MNEKHSELMSAFVDGEAVDPASLAIALEDAQARQVLVDFVRLREATRQAEGEISPSLAALRRQPVWRMAVPLPAVAALVLVAVLASWFMPRAAGIDGPPDPPAPARTLTFEPGVDWREWQP